MIFQFPDFETIRLAITTGLVPAEVASAPAEVSFDPDHRPAVKSAGGMPPKAMQNALKKVGVRPIKEHVGPVQSVDCWPQLLPITKLAGVPEVTSTTPVLFDLPSAEMAIVVTEMLRLGNDRQSFRTVAGANGDHVLLKVIGPPYYTLLRAIDKSTQKGASVAAFIERAPRVWVELGHDHALAAKIHPAAGQVLLLRPERGWTAIVDGPFQDVYESLKFELPSAAVEWQESQLKGKLAVPMRLVPGNAADVPELWVVTRNAIDQLDALVRDADERLMSRLSFAVATENGASTIVLKARPSKLPPPVLPLDEAIGFKPYWKLPNLFVPVGRRLMPTLRRDAVRRLLADDPAQVVWLMPGTVGDGRFTPEVLPDESFRPLEDWIDYIIDHEHEALKSWIGATRFNFDSFECSEDQPDRPKAPPPAERGKKGSHDPAPSIDLKAEPKANKKKAAKSDSTEFAALAPIAPNELKVKIDELEKVFLAGTGGLDEPARQALWPELARLNAALGDASEAAIAWTNAFWELDEIPIEQAREWLLTEDPKASTVPTAAEWDAALGDRSPSPIDARRFAARVLVASLSSPVPETFLARLPKVREYLDRYEGMLGLRVVWLAWVHLARAGHGQADVLGLARVRDRLLQRLLEQGLNKERDLPYFLRTAGGAGGERARIVRDRALRVHRLVEKWHSGEDVKVNKPYVDLMFAFGLARLGEATAARDLLASAERELLKTGDAVHVFLYQAFKWRVESALQGKPHTGGLPPELIAKLDKIDAGHGKQGINPRYVVDRMREQSWILEPQEKCDPNRDMKKHSAELVRTLAQLADSKDPAGIATSVRQLAKKNPDLYSRLEITQFVGLHGPRVGEEFTIEYLAKLPQLFEAFKAQSDPRESTDKDEARRKVLRQSLFLAAHYDRRELVGELFRTLLERIRVAGAGERQPLIAEAARECIRSLSRLGMKDEIGQFLAQVSQVVIGDKSLTQLRLMSGADWREVLIALLALSEGWLFFGDYERAKPLLDAALEQIRTPEADALHRSIQAQWYTKLVQAYVSAVGKCPVDEALRRIEFLLENVRALPNSYTTHAHYSRLHLNVVEEVIRSLVSDNIALGDQAKRWLDDDEFLVRRRVHADMRRILKQSGL